MSEKTLKERMETRKDDFILRVDTHTDMVGQALAKVTPLMTQAISAICVGYATYEGVNLFFGAHWAIGLVAGLVAGIATEGIGFIAVDERDKAEAHNRRTADPSQHVSMAKGNAYVAGSFIITLAIVAAFESVPAIIRYAESAASLPEVLFRCGLLVFPFLSRLGANIYAFRSVRESVDTAIDDKELRKLKLDLAKQELIAKSEARIAKVSEKLSGKVSGKVSQHTLPEVESFPDDSEESLGRQIVLYLKDNPGALLSAVANHVGWSEPKVSKEISSLIDMGVLHAEKQGRRKVVTVNGNHEEYLDS